MTDTQHSPLAAERRSHVLNALASDGFVRVAQLIEDLGVAPVTLRRDLAQMEKDGLLVRVHGGAVANENSSTEGPSAVPDPVTLVASDEPNTIAVLVPSLNYYWPGVVRGMEVEARRHGFRLLLRGASYELQDERPVLERLSRTEQLAGLVVAPNTDTPHSADVLEWLHRSELPAVLVERDAIYPATGEPAESVTTDHALGAVLAARHFAHLGHQRVGLVLSRNSPTSRKIAAGWHAACNDLGLRPHRHMEQVLPDRSTPEFSEIVGAALDHAVAEGITALLVHSDPEAMAVVDLALNRGISVPEDLSIIAYDDEVAELFTPALTAVSPPRGDVGRAAIDLLTRRIAEPDRPTQRILLSPRLNLRESVAPPRLPLRRSSSPHGNS